MPMTLLEAKNHLKSTRGLTRNREDGLLPDDLIEEAIGNALKRLARDCDLLPTMIQFHLVAGQHIYPLDERIVHIRDFWRQDTSGNRQPMRQITQEQHLAGHNPVTNTTLNPYQYAYPIFQGRKYQWYIEAPPNKDFDAVSRVTTEARRTIIDSGANFGRTLSGDRISPGDLVWNTADFSFGYVENLDMVTAKASGTIASVGSGTLTVAGANWDAVGVKVDDLICRPLSGLVTDYAFVTAMSGDVLSYEDMRGTITAFEATHTVKVGVANKIRLNTAAPHRGLRQGTNNRFAVAAATVTMTGTTFTDTRCTGSAPTGAAVGQEAIAAGGSHGIITAVGDTYVDVDHWIGGVPAANENVEIRTCDSYTIETRPRIQPVVWLKPTPSVSDTPGQERLWASVDMEPHIPSDDWEYLDVPAKFEDAFTACLEWQAARLAGTKSPDKLKPWKAAYFEELQVFQGDVHEQARGEIMSPWTNRYPDDGQGNAYEGVRSGITYDAASMADEQNA